MVDLDIWYSTERDRAFNLAEPQPHLSVNNTALLKDIVMLTA